ncbi:hypothetical protein HDU96_008625 [Phlyctochytrium bullatum]|nr:hypothetical protein HDU96_008625 [Phlyctochytrium bullatum]
MESTAFFRSENSWGSGTTTTSFVALLAAADALSQFVDAVQNLPKDIIFILFGSEPYGFSGSKRFVQDLLTTPVCKDTGKRDSCKYPSAACTNPCIPTYNYTEIDFEKIDAIVEFSHVGGVGLSDVLNNPVTYLHVDDFTTPGVNDLLANFRGRFNFTSVNGTDYDMQFSDAFSSADNRKLPPSSAMSFLAKKNIPAVVIADYRTEYNNKYGLNLLDFDNQGLLILNTMTDPSGTIPTRRTFVALLPGQRKESSRPLGDLIHRHC